MSDFMAIAGCAIACSGADISIERTAMTPQQATLLPCPFCGGPVELERTTGNFEREFGGARPWWGVVCRNTRGPGGTCAIQQRPSASEDAAVERWNRRAPAPTEPAVAFMCAALAFAKAHIDSDELERIDDMNPTDEGERAVLASHDDYNTTKAALLVCYRALATPASPAVPEPTMPCWSCKKPYTAEQRLYADGRCPHCEVDIELDDDDAVQAVPAPAPLAPIPDVLFDGMAVYEEITRAGGHMRTSAENVSEVLDAVVRLLRASQPTSTPEAVNLLVEEAKRVIGKN